MNTKENCFEEKRFLTLNLETHILDFVKVSFRKSFLAKIHQENV